MRKRTVRTPQAKPVIPKRPSRRSNLRRFALIVGALAAVGIGVLGWRAMGSPEPVPESTVLAEKVEMPTDINANFLHQVETCFIPVAKVYGYRLDITWGFRSAEEQDALYAQGRTEPGDIVTNARGGRSLHNYGLAVDVADIDDGYEINWNRLTKMARWCGLEHGDRGMEDLPHFQYRGGLSLDDLQAGKRPKPLKLPCQLLEERKKQEKALTTSDLKSCKAPKF
jgi:hypothetical protein